MNLKGISATSVAGAWVEASEWLVQNQHEWFNLIVEIDHQGQDVSQLESEGAAEILDAFLERRKLQPTSTVANTLFPQYYYEAYGGEGLYEAFERNWPRMRKISAKNRQGEDAHYFRRMTHVLKKGPTKGKVEVHNPLKHVVDKIRASLSQRGPKRCAYPVAIYQPDKDSTRLIGGLGFPCLSTIDFKIDKGRLHLNAMYRNQLYIERAFGNFLGLSRLLRFVATETSLAPGIVTCWATHAELEKHGGLEELFNATRREIPGT